jgi:hypothetical protein
VAGKSAELYGLRGKFALKKNKWCYHQKKGQYTAKEKTMDILYNREMLSSKNEHRGAAVLSI